VPKILTLLCLLSFTIPSLAEVNVISLYADYEKASNRDKVEIANQIFEATRDLYDTVYACDAKTEIPFLDAMMQDVMANQYFDQDDFEQSVFYITKCLSYERVQDSTFLYEDAVSLASILYFRLGDFPEAIRYAEESLRLDRETKKLENISSSLNNVAGILLGAGQPEEAEKYALEALEIERKLDRPHTLAIRLGIASEVFLKEGKYDEALSYGEEALKVEPVPEKKAVRQSQVAAVLMEMGKENEAYPLLVEAKASLDTTSNINSLSIVLGQLARIASHRGAVKEAVGYLQESMAICEKTGNKMLESKNCYLLYQNLRASRPQEAMNYLERYASMNEGLYNEKLAEQLQSFNVKYNKAETQHQLEIQAEQLSRHRLWNFIVIGLLVALTIGSILLIRLLRVQSRNNKILQQASIAKDELLRIANEEKLQAETARQQILQVADHFSALGEGQEVELTKREIQIIQLFCRGLMSKEIADQLDISVRTVETHKSHIYRKLGISTSVELLRYAQDKLGLKV